MSSANPFEPKPKEHYRDLAKSGKCEVNLTQDQACVILKAHDYGVKSLDASDIELLDQVCSKLKCEIWP